MELTQDFDADFDILTAGLQPGYDGPPYAFMRFADGEAGIMQGIGHRAKSDGWEIPPGPAGGGVAALLHEALLADLDGLYLGITASEHHPDHHRWLIDNLACPWDKISFAELFIFANYERFLSLDLRHCTFVAPAKLELPACKLVPIDAIATGWDWRPTVDELINWVDPKSPILVSAGPMANILIHDYWTRCPPSRRRTIIDAGSAADGKFGHRRTRQYQHPGHTQRAWKPKFWPAE